MPLQYHLAHPRIRLQLRLLRLDQRGPPLRKTGLSRSLNQTFLRRTTSASGRPRGGGQIIAAHALHSVKKNLPRFLGSQARRWKDSGRGGFLGWMRRPVAAWALKSIAADAGAADLQEIGVAGVRCSKLVRELLGEGNGSSAVTQRVKIQLSTLPITSFLEFRR